VDRLALADILRIVLREAGWRPWTVGSLAVLVYLLACADGGARADGAARGARGVAGSRH
jgi:hypothetical protein